MQLLRHALPFAISLSLAAQPTSPAKFDVATIKPASTPCPGGFPTCFPAAPAGVFTVQGAVLKLLIMLAYDVQETQISGGPDWLDKDRWDVTAKVEDFDATMTRANTFPALRALLEDRFKLKVHRETKEVLVFALEQVKGGSKLGDTKTEGRPGTLVGSVRGGMYVGNQVPLSNLTQMLAPSLGRPIVDRTGLTGVHDFKLTWDASTLTDRGLPGMQAPALPQTPESHLPSFHAAMEEQLGLKLESLRAPAEVLVIDSVELPSGN